MPIPRTRAELMESLDLAWRRLEDELDEAGPHAGALPCVGPWSVRDLLAVRAWWSERVVDWIEAGRRDERPELPAPGYRWTETPRLNDAIVAGSTRASYSSVRARLRRAAARVVAVAEDLDDRELLRPGAFAWAGRYPIARWISLNATRQYTTARTLVRKALRAAGREPRSRRARRP